MNQNQIIKQDADKLPLSQCAPELIEAMAIVRQYGLKKYPADSWKEVNPKRYLDALYRHLLEVIKADDLYKKDEESGLLHLQHMACNLGFMLALQPKQKGVTVRPILSQQEEDEEICRQMDYQDRINQYNKENGND